MPRRTFRSAPTVAVLSLAALALAGLGACAVSASVEGEPAGAASAIPPSEAPADPGLSAADGGGQAPELDPEAACVAVVADAKPQRRPVDIVWLVDNSASMEPAVRAVTAGLNDFAATIGQRQLDYRVIMLSLRGQKPVTRGGSKRYPVCVPAPLAGDDACGNGPRFVHSTLDVKSVQPLEQLLGTLDQTAGYTPADERGAEPWRAALRPDATKTFVVVTDDDSRLSARDFERFAGGANPHNPSLRLPPGLLDASRNGQFEGYVLAAIYGWGSETDPAKRCAYADRTEPPSAGETYTELVRRTGGPRAQICQRAEAWRGFFDEVAKAVVTRAKIACDVDIPTPPGQVLDPTRVNVDLEVSGRKARLKKAVDSSACGLDVAWHYDDERAPTKVRLCPAACSLAQGGLAGGGDDTRLGVAFGCRTEIK
jgi:hypothetical protein